MHRGVHGCRGAGVRADVNTESCLYGDVSTESCSYDGVSTESCGHDDVWYAVMLLLNPMLHVVPGSIFISMYSSGSSHP